MKDIASIYKLYVNELFAYACYLGFDKEIVMDAIHDVFLKLSIDNTILLKANNIKFYLFRALKNKLVDIHKAKKLNLELLMPKAGDTVPFEIHITAEDDLIDMENQQLIIAQLNEMLSSLTERQREIIHLRYIQELEYEEIASLMGISVHGCRKLVSKAILSLREKYGLSVVIVMLLQGAFVLVEA